MSGPPVYLYLDFDGVLHSAEVYVYGTRTTVKTGPKAGQRLGPGIVCLEGELFEHLGILEEILAPFPNVQIVLSTSWVRERDFAFAKSRLGALEARVVGATWHTAMKEMGDALAFDAMGRGHQVLMDVRRRGAPYWVAIDDHVEGFRKEHMANVVETGPLALADPRAQQQLQAKLQIMSAHAQAELQAEPAAPPVPARRAHKSSP